MYAQGCVLWGVISPLNWRENKFHYNRSGQATENISRAPEKTYYLKCLVVNQKIMRQTKIKKNGPYPKKKAGNRDCLDKEQDIERGQNLK